MADINIEIDPEKFRQFAVDMLNRLRGAEIELKTYQLLFQSLIQQGVYNDLEGALQLVRQTVETPVNQKYDAALEEVRKFVQGPIPDDAFLKLIQQLPSTNLKN